MNKPKYFWDVSKFPDKLFEQSDFTFNTPNVKTHTHRLDAAEFTTEDGIRVLRRNFKQGLIGAKPDGWFWMRPQFEDTFTASMQVFLKFPVGSIKLLRAGKLPIGFANVSDPQHGTYFPPGTNPPGYSGNVMYDIGIRENGDPIWPNDWPTNPTRFALKDYTYAWDVDRKPNAYKFAASNVYRNPATGKVIFINEGEWFGIHQLVKIDPVNSKGYVHTYICCSETGGEWVLVGRIDDKKLSDKPLNESHMVWFNGGGNDDPAPVGWSPVEDTFADGVGWSIWMNEEIPDGNGLNQNGLPILAFSKDETAPIPPDDVDLEEEIKLLNQVIEDLQALISQKDELIIGLGQSIKALNDALNEKNLQLEEIKKAISTLKNI